MRLISLAPARPVCDGRPAREAALKYCFASLLAFTLAASAGVAQQGSSPAKLTDPATEAVQRMVKQNAQRTEDLKYYTSLRHYHVEFHGLGRTIIADMHAQVVYKAGSGKTFQVIDESGSHALVNHVLLKLLDTESDDSHQQQTALSPANYDFVFQNQATENGRPVYVFAVAPKVKNKLLYRGTVFIDANDYAVVRIEAQPAENPSFWITGTEIHAANAKIGEFWLPQSNRSESKTRFGGTAVLTIDYGTYQFDPPRAESRAAARPMTAGGLDTTPAGNAQ
jgi:hypothetical protein